MPDTRDIQDFVRNTGFGAGSDRTKFEADGTAHRGGDATTWDDLVSSLIGSRLSSTAGKVGYDYDDLAIVFNPGGSISTEADRVGLNQQYPHAAVVDGSVRFHIHWWQDTAVTREITVEYRIQKNNELKEDVWTQVVVDTNTNNVFAYTSGALKQITSHVDIDMTDAGISATVQIRFARTDSNSGDMLMTFADSHVERDTEGSRSEFVK